MLEVKISSLYVKQSWVMLSALRSEQAYDKRDKKKKIHDEIDDDVFAIV